MELSRIVSVLGIGLVAALLFSRPHMTLPSLSQSQDVSVADLTQSAQGKTRAVGIDVSHYQGTIQWPKVVADKIQFAYLKATDGITYTDPRYHANVTELKQSELLHGAYHFYEPNDDAVAQAKHFLTKVTLTDVSLAPVLDVEIHEQVLATDIAHGVRTWLEYVEQATNCRPVIYTYSDFYQTYLGETFDHYPLWLADYAKQPTLPRAQPALAIWQHSQKGRVMGIATEVDLDIAEVPLEQLQCRATLLATEA